VHNDIAGTNGNQARITPDLDPKCPSCGLIDESRGHILYCAKEGRVDAMMKSIDLLGQWLVKVGTNLVLRRVIIDYAKGRGGSSMVELMRQHGSHFSKFAALHDIIGWQKFTVGMISNDLLKIQQ